MSGKVMIHVRETRGQKGQKRLAAATEPPPAARDAPSSPPVRVPRVARVLALAHHWQGLIRSGTVRDQADLARLVGVSRARISQVMRLLDLAPDIQEAVLDGLVDGKGAELALRAKAGLPLWSKQRRPLGSRHPASPLP